MDYEDFVGMGVCLACILLGMALVISTIKDATKEPYHCPHCGQEIRKP